MEPQKYQKFVFQLSALPFSCELWLEIATQLAVSFKARKIALNGAFAEAEALSSKKRVLAITRIQLVCLDAHFNDIKD